MRKKVFNGPCYVLRFERSRKFMINLKVFPKHTFVKDWCRFVLQYLKITMHQRDPGIIIVNDLPKLEI